MVDKKISRLLEKQLNESLSFFPVVAILGARQVGKSTLAKMVLKTNDNVVYLDLEKPSDLTKLNNPELYFSQQKGKLICLDEIQRKPEFFSILRSIVDQNKRAGQFLILGSASIDLLNQSSESLAGRIDYLELAPFLEPEIDDFFKYWIRGGFPDSYLAPSHDLSERWRENFIKTFLERDIPQLNFRIPAENLRRFWQMCAHYHGQLLNYSSIGKSLNLSHTTIRHYMDVMQSTFMMRLLPPFHTNKKKRLVKAPKVYIRDTGILHRLLKLSTFDDCAGHPVFGASFEGLVIENIAMNFPDWELSFYRTQSGAEIDLILNKGTHCIAIEIKATKAPQIKPIFFTVSKEVNASQRFIISFVDEPFKIKDNTTVCNLTYFISTFGKKL